MTKKFPETCIFLTQGATCQRPGYSYADGEIHPGVVMMAAPFVNPRMTIIAAA